MLSALLATILIVVSKTFTKFGEGLLCFKPLPNIGKGFLFLSEINREG